MYFLLIDPASLIVIALVVIFIVGFITWMIMSRNKPSPIVKNAIDYYLEQKRKESFTKEADDKWLEETFKE